MDTSLILSVLGTLIVAIVVYFALRARKTSTPGEQDISSIIAKVKSKDDKKPQTKDKEKEKEKDKGKEVGKKTALVRHAACVAELKGLPRASSLSFDPKGRYLAVTCDDRSVRLYQYDTLLQADRKHYKMNIEGDVPSFCRFSPDGHYLLVVLRDSQTFNVYKIFSHRDATTGKPYELARAYPARHAKGLLSVHMSQNLKYLLTCGADTSLVLWNVKGEVLATLNTRQMGNNGASISADSTLFAAATLMSDVRVWKIKEGPKGEFVGVDDKNFTTLTGKEGHKAGVNAIAFSAHSATAYTTSKDNTLKKWNLAGDYKQGFEPEVLFTGKNPNTGEKSGYGLVAPHPDDDRVAVLSERDVHVWSVRQGAVLARIENAHGGDITDVQWSHDGTLLATSCTDSVVRIFRF